VAFCRTFPGYTVSFCLRSAFRLAPQRNSHYRTGKSHAVSTQAAFAEFLEGRTLRPNQIEFIAMMIAHLTEHGVMDAGRLWESPYIDLDTRGVDGVFGADTDRLLAIIDDIRQRAVA
jgi:hypothetical protein